MALLPLPPQPMIEEELERLFASDALRRAPSHQRLLRHLVDKRLAGDEASLRETSIALEVFRRDPATYDPQTDPIVRVTVGRLRERLASHYGTFDTPPRLRIVLPKGRYVPDFVAVADAAVPRRGMAILRPCNATGSDEYETLIDAFAERLGDGLARLGVARIIARDSVDRASAKGETMVAVAHRLRVEWVLETVLACEATDDLRITLRLCGDDGTIRWIETTARSAADRFPMLDTITDRVLARFAGVLKGESPAHAAPDQHALPEATRSALDLARFLLHQRSPQAVQQAMDLASTITRNHSDCATAWAVLGNAQYLLSGFMNGDFGTLHAAARESTERALAIDPDQGLAAMTAGALIGLYDCDPVGGIRRLRDLLHRAPHHVLARCSLAALLQYTGAFDEALAEIELARSHDPLSPTPRMHRANVLAYARRHDEARSEWRVARAAGAPAFHAEVMGAMNDLWAGDYPCAEAALSSAAARFPDNPTPPMCLAMVSGAAGRHEDARRRLDACVARHPKISFYHRAMLAATMRDKETVLASLRAASIDCDPIRTSLGADPTFDWLADDADFDTLLRSWGLPGWHGRAAPGS